MKFITQRQVFNKTHTLYKGSTVEIKREIEVEGQTVLVFSEIGCDQEFRTTKTSDVLKEVEL